jgi:two-component system NtrC family sensor kinase
MAPTFFHTQQDTVADHIVLGEMNHAGIRFLVEISAVDAGADEVQAWFLEETIQILDATSASIYLCDESGSNKFTKKRLTVGGQWTCQVIPTAESSKVVETIRSGNLLITPGISGGKKIFIPLMAEGETLGVLAVEKEQERFDSDLLIAIGESFANNLTKSRQAYRVQDTIQAMETFLGQLLNSRNTLRALFDSSPAAIYIVDPGYKLIAINMKRADLTGCSPQDLVGQQCFSALYQRGTPCPGCLVKETIQSGNSTRRVERRRISGASDIDLEISTFPIWDNDRNILQAFLFEEDITERQQLQASLAQSEKLAAVGQLAAGVAHEINNPLTTILANAQLLKRSLSAQDVDRMEMVGLIIQASDRTAQIVRDLLDFARCERYELSPTDINETIQRTLGLIGHELGSRSISLQFDPAMDLPAVNASQDHLQGVWLNLLINAIDAIDQGPGKIYIRTKKTEDAVQVLVSDSGGGIPMEKLSRIFEPFYTTKEPGRGTGLGLSVCHQIVTRHGGQILVSSQVDEGTTFTIILPLT